MVLPTSSKRKGCLIEMMLFCSNYLKKITLFAFFLIIQIIHVHCGKFRDLKRVYRRKGSPPTTRQVTVSKALTHFLSEVSEHVKHVCFLFQNSNMCFVLASHSGLLAFFSGPPRSLTPQPLCLLFLFFGTFCSQSSHDRLRLTWLKRSVSNLKLALSSRINSTVWETCTCAKSHAKQVKTNKQKCQL